MKKSTIKVTVLLENSCFVGLFERTDERKYAAARKIFGSEPTDAELYDFVLNNYHELKFTEPHNFKLIIKRKNPKRIKREVRREMEKAKSKSSGVSYAQEILKLDLEKNKKSKKIISSAQKQLKKDEQFQKRSEKRKEKHRGH